MLLRPPIKKQQPNRAQQLPKVQPQHHPVKLYLLKKARSLRITLRPIKASCRGRYKRAICLWALVCSVVQWFQTIEVHHSWIEITTEEGADARSIFDGEVLDVQIVPGTKSVFIIHGDYITVYLNLSYG